MTVRQLYNWCKAFKDKDAEVYLVKDWDKLDEYNNLSDLYRLEDVTYQVNTVDEGLDFKDEYEVLLVVDDKPAKGEMKDNY